MKETEIEEGNKLIALYMGAVKIRLAHNRDSETEFGFSKPQPEDKRLWEIKDLKYHSSWDWQIPVYSKLCKEMKTLMKLNNEAEMQFYYKFKNIYEVAVIENNPIEGFKIIVDNLKWFNTQSK